MDLEELQKKLYKKQEPDITGRPQGPKIFDQQQIPQQDISAWRGEPKDSLGPALGSRQKKIIKIIAICLLIIALAVVGFFAWRSRYTFDSSQVYLSITGAERLTSGEKTTYVVHYKNPTKIALQQVKLVFIYPEGAVPVNGENVSRSAGRVISEINLPDIAPGKEGQREFVATVVGLKDEQRKAMAELSYRPVNVSSVYKNSAEFSGVIYYVPLILGFDLPTRSVSGQKLTVALKYHNISDVSFSNLSLTIQYPPGFSFESAAPLPTQDANVWNIKEIGPREEKTIVVSGRLTGAKNEVKTFSAKIEQKIEEGTKIISQESNSTLVGLPPLSVTTEINGSRDYLASVGEQLNYTLSFQNTVDVPIDSVFITLKFNTKVLDFSTLRIDKSQGYFNSVDNSIVWNESSFPALKLLQPGEQREVSFSIKVKNQPPVLNYNDQNFLINTVAKINSPNTPLSLRGTPLEGTDDLSVKLNSKLYISAKGYFNPPDKIITNSGPLPPIVGQQTTYVIYWQVANLSNDVDEVVVQSYLPPYVHWLGNFSPKDANVKYDQATGKLTWSLGKLAANTGIASPASSPAKRLIFQIGLIPAYNQVGRSVDLLKQTTISGKDLFTQALLQNSAASIQSNLPDDPSVGYVKGQVVSR